MEFGQRVKNLREALGLTQSDLADAVGYSDKTAISRIETGKSDVSRGKISELAETLHTSPSYRFRFGNSSSICDRHSD